MVAFVTSTMIGIIGCVVVYLYGKRRPVGAPLSWGEAMVGATFVFFLFFWWYGVIPHQWLMWAGNQLRWRSDKILRQLEAMLAVADRQTSLVVSGNGDVIEPDDGILAIGSGGPYALAAARAMIETTELTAREIVERSLRIAGEICIHTNTNLSILELKSD